MKSLKELIFEQFVGKEVRFVWPANTPFQLGKFISLTQGGRVIIEVDKKNISIPMYYVYPILKFTHTYDEY